MCLFICMCVVIAFRGAKLQKSIETTKFFGKKMMFLSDFLQSKNSKTFAEGRKRLRVLISAELRTFCFAVL